MIVCENLAHIERNGYLQMISSYLAEELKLAGLAWQPKLHDFFAIPDTELAQRVFVVSDMMIDVQQLLGQQTITFNGAVEWSLDYIVITEALWMPTETQLRLALQEYLMTQKQPAVQLTSSLDSYHCHIRFMGKAHEFNAPSASDAYGQALLYVLKQTSDWGHSSAGPTG